MIIRENEDSKIEQMKAALSISGDVYLDDANHIESMESHKKLMASYDYPSSAQTIEEAETERAAFEQELERRRQEYPDPEPTLEDAMRWLGELGVNTDA